MPLLQRAVSDIPVTRSGLASRGPAFLAGAGAAATSWGAVLAPALVAWVAAPESSVPWTGSVAVGSAAWFLGHGAPLRVGAVTVSLTPLLLLGFVLGSALWGARRALRGTGGGRTEMVVGVRRDVADVALGFAGGYAAVAVLALLSTLGGEARPHPGGALLGVVSVVLVAVLVAVGREVRGGWRGAAPTLAEKTDQLVPSWLRQAVRPAVSALAVLACAGLLIVFIVLVRGGDRVTEITGQLGVGAVGALVLAVGQVLLLPNFTLWAVAWMAGPGFSVAAGSSVTLTAANPGLQPMLPVLAALPAGGPLPGWLTMALLIPVGAGLALVRSQSRAADGAATGPERIATILTASLLVGVVVGLVAVLGSGSLGAERLGSVGPTPWPLAGAVAAEVLAGAVLWLLGEWLLDLVRGRSMAEDTDAQ